jgi:hypothetical protein
MNIFYLSNDPIICAQQHVNRHVIKMILEYCQLLSTAHRILDGKLEIKLQPNKSGKIKKKKYYLLENECFDDEYSIPKELQRSYLLNQKCCAHSHINHPSGVWVRKSKANYLWLVSLLEELHKEFLFRYPGKPDKAHKTYKLYFEFLKNPPKNIKDDVFTEPTPAMPDRYKVENDSIQSYKNYYKNDKLKMASWKNRDIPEWFYND